MGETTARRGILAIRLDSRAVTRLEWICQIPAAVRSKRRGLTGLKGCTRELEHTAYACDPGKGCTRRSSLAQAYR